MLTQGQDCWRIEQAREMAVIVDAEDYFCVAREAFLQARHRIMLVGWDFDTRITLSGGERMAGEPATIGEFLYWLVEHSPDFELYLLRWDMGALKGVFRGSTIFTVLKWMRHPRIHVKLDGHHPTGSSHHQKIVSIDDCLAFCGGIDMTGDRWDTRAHLDHEPRRKQPSGKPYKPWHDATTALSGPAAMALGEACRDRWERASGVKLKAVAADQTCWPEGLEPDFRDVEVAIARTHPEMDDQQPVHEIEALFLAQIAAAKRLLYCESKYFAARRIAEAIGKRLAEPDGPEIVIVNPLTAQGWLEPLAMDTARARLMTALQQQDRYGRLRMYHPFTAGGEPIYVHAKITIVDDDQLRIGSANMNNRSLRLDTECDVMLDKGRPSNRGSDKSIAAIRNGLLAEHLDVPVAEIVHELAASGSLIATIEHLRGSGRSLRPYQVPDIDGVKAWLAENEVLDPEGPSEMFEPLSARGLLRRLRKPR